MTTRTIPESVEELTAYQQEKNKRKAISTENLRKARLAKEQIDLKRREQNKQQFPHLHVKSPTLSQDTTSSIILPQEADVNPPNQQSTSPCIPKVPSADSSVPFMGVIISFLTGLFCKAIGVAINILIMSLITTIISVLVGSYDKNINENGGNTEIINEEDSLEEEIDVYNQ